MDILNNPNLNPEIKLLILLYILAYVLPQILDEIPEIYWDNGKLEAAYLTKILSQNCER